MRIIFIRHAERFDRTNSFSWLYNIGTGSYIFDTPLSQNGHKLAYDKAVSFNENNIKLTKIYCSPYIRTITTALEFAKIYSNVSVIIDPKISEYQPLFSHNTNIAPYGIAGKFPETYHDLETRLDDFIKMILKTNLLTDDILVVTHSECIRSLGSIMAKSFETFKFDDNNIPYLSTLTLTYNSTNDMCDSVEFELN